MLKSLIYEVSIGSEISFRFRYDVFTWKAIVKRRDDHIFDFWIYLESESLVATDFSRVLSDAESYRDPSESYKDPSDSYKDPSDSYRDPPSKDPVLQFWISGEFPETKADMSLVRTVHVKEWLNKRSEKYKGNLDLVMNLSNALLKELGVSRSEIIDETVVKVEVLRKTFYESLRFLKLLTGKLPVYAQYGYTIGCFDDDLQIPKTPMKVIRDLFSRLSVEISPELKESFEKLLALSLGEFVHQLMENDYELFDQFQNLLLRALADLSTLSTSSGPSEPRESLEYIYDLFEDNEYFMNEIPEPKDEITEIEIEKKHVLKSGNSR